MKRKRVSNFAVLQFSTSNAGQYVTLNCKLLLFWFPCKWRYINVRIFNL